MPPPPTPPPDAADAPAPEGRRFEGSVYEMLWDCAFCGTRKLLGKTHRFCPNCGAAQDPDRRYFPSDAEKVAVEDHVYFGADRVCPACGTPASARAAFCGQCGSSLSDAAAASTRARERRGAAEAFGEGVPRDRAAERRAAAEARPASRPARPPLAALVLGLVALGLVCGALVWAFGRTSAAAVEVVDRDWRREVDVDVFGPHGASAWCDAVPAGAYDLSRSRAVRYSQQVPDGEICEVVRIDNGDGTYHEETACHTVYRDEPVYDDRCTFTVLGWSHARTLGANGRGFDSQPAWPAVRLARTGACVGCEREAGRRETYAVYFAAPDSGERLRCDFRSQAEWSAFAEGSRWRLEVRSLTGAPDCGSLAPLTD